ncbi:MAG: hypothetical protein QMB94_14245, partial [Phycisphaerales bacterium]
ISAGVRGWSSQIEGRLEMVNSRVVFGFECCMLEASNTPAWMASGVANLDEIVFRVFRTSG